MSHLLRQMPQLENAQMTRKMISHEYLKSDRNRAEIYNEIIDLFSDAYFISPNSEMMTMMGLNGAEMFYYINDFSALDIFGNDLVNRSSAAHGTDMLYLLGPTMYKNFFSTDFQSFAETKFAKNFKSIVGEFAYYGAPISLSNIGAWKLYDKEIRNYFNIYGSYASSEYKRNEPEEFWSNYLPSMSAQIAQIEMLNGTSLLMICFL